MEALHGSFHIKLSKKKCKTTKSFGGETLLNSKSTLFDQILDGGNGKI